MLDANKYLFKSDAKRVGSSTGQSVAIVLIIILVYLYYNGSLPFCEKTTIVISVILFVTLQSLFRWYMGTRWEHYELIRNKLQMKGMLAKDAFQAVLNGSYKQML
jgi:hypothetical protein